jgi:RNase P/RNase MRP subunit POP5
LKSRSISLNCGKARVCRATLVHPLFPRDLLSQGYYPIDLGLAYARGDDILREKLYSSHLWQALKPLATIALTDLFYLVKHTKLLLQLAYMLNLCTNDRLSLGINKDLFAIDILHTEPVNIEANSFYCALVLRICAASNIFTQIRMRYREDLLHLIKTANIFLPWEVRLVLEHDDPIRTMKIVSNRANKFADRTRPANDRKQTNKYHQRIHVLETLVLLLQIKEFMRANIDLYLYFKLHGGQESLKNTSHNLVCLTARFNTDRTLFKMDEFKFVSPPTFFVAYHEQNDLSVEAISGILNRKERTFALDRAALSGFKTVHDLLISDKLNALERKYSVKYSSMALSAAYGIPISTDNTDVPYYYFRLATGTYLDSITRILKRVKQYGTDEQYYQLYVRFGGCFNILDYLSRLMLNRVTICDPDVLATTSLIRGCYNEDHICYFATIMPWLQIRLAYEFNKNSFIKELIKCQPLRNQTRDLHKRIADTILLMVKNECKSVNYDFFVFYRSLMLTTLLGGYRTAKVRPRFSAAYRLRSFILGLRMNIFRKLVILLKEFSRFVLREYMAFLIRNRPDIYDSTLICASTYGNFISSACDSFRNLIDNIESTPLDILSLIEVVSRSLISPMRIPDQLLPHMPMYDKLKHKRYTLIAMNKIPFSRYLYNVIYEIMQRVYMKALLLCEQYDRYETLYSHCLETVKNIAKITRREYTSSDCIEIANAAKQITTSYKSFVYNTAVLGTDRNSQMFILRAVCLNRSTDEKTLLVDCEQLTESIKTIETQTSEINEKFGQQIVDPLQCLNLLEAQIYNVREQLRNGNYIYILSTTEKTMVWKAVLAARNNSNGGAHDSLSDAQDLFETLKKTLSQKALSGLIAVYLKYGFCMGKCIGGH